MRTPANPTKQFMAEILTTVNQFFKKVSTFQIQFQLPEPYLIPKKGDMAIKTKTIQKDNENNTEKVKLLKKAYKKYREEMLNDKSMNDKLKDLTQKQKLKQIKKSWKSLTEGERLKWLSVEKKKKEAIANKLKAKSIQNKNSAKPAAKQNNQNKNV